MSCMIVITGAKHKANSAFSSPAGIGYRQLLSRSGLDRRGPGYLGGGGGVVRPKIVGLLKKNKRPTFFASPDLMAKECRRNEEIVGESFTPAAQTYQIFKNFPPPAAITIRSGETMDFP